MNDIKLPPLPEPITMGVEEIDWNEFIPVTGYTDAQMHAFAAAAVLADRAQRGEPVHIKLRPDQVAVTPYDYGPQPVERRIEFTTTDPDQHHSLSLSEAARVLAAFFQAWPGGVDEMEAAERRYGDQRKPLTVKQIDQITGRLDSKSSGFSAYALVRAVEAAHSIGKEAT